MGLSKISRYRTEIMGVSILWVMFFHSGIDLPGWLAPVRFLKTIGYGAVDLFFFLSGFGLFYSWSKSRSLKNFYLARLSRLAPSYWIVVAIYALTNACYGGKLSLAMVAYMSIGLDFILDGVTIFWFIPAIACCYLVSPFALTCIHFDVSNRNLTRNIAIAIASAFILSWVISASTMYHLLILTLRLPVFILGMYCGYVLSVKYRLIIFDSIVFNVGVLLVGLAALSGILAFTDSAMRWRYGLWWYPFILITYPLILCFALFFDYMDQGYPGNQFYEKFKQLVTYCGKYSLEIYLIHVSLFKGVPVVLNEVFPGMIESRANILRLPEYILLACISILLAPILSFLAARMLSRVRL
jgi:peptidoglycan/LPS O-acetylase OafA/YrhL